MPTKRGLGYMAGVVFITTSLFFVSDDFPLKRNIRNANLGHLSSFQKENSTALEVPSDQKDLPWWQKFFCDLRHDKIFRNRKGIETLNILQRDVTPDEKANNIFFIETSCKLYPHLRELCAIESWAGNHPHATVWYILNSPVVNDVYGHLRRVRDIYPNIMVVAVDLDLIFKDTPLEELFKSQKWMSYESLAGQQLGNILRIALVWRFGGTYSDTDVICLKDTSNLHNAIGFHDYITLNNANLQGNSPRLDFYWKLMEHINDNFEMFTWGHNGPIATTETALKYCNKTSFAEGRLDTTITLTCGEMNFLTEDVFNLVHYGFTPELFETDDMNHFDIIFKSSFGVHFWNKVSSIFKVGKRSPYEIAAERHCPITHEFSVSPPTFNT